MASENFDRAVEHVLSVEGGFQKNPKDKGNWTGGEVGVGALVGTKFGISAASYANKGVDIPNLTREEAVEIYKRDFWDRVRADDLPPGVDFMAFDAAIHHGTGRSASWLQELTGATVDGAIGPNTLAKVQEHGRPDELMRAFSARRLDFVRRIGPSNPEFFNGWVNRLDKIGQFARSFREKPTAE